MPSFIRYYKQFYFNGKNLSFLRSDLRIQAKADYIDQMNNALLPTLNEMRARIRSDIRLGLPVNFSSGAFVAIEHLSRARFDDIIKMGNVRVALSTERALNLHLSHDPSRPSVLNLPKNYSFEKLVALADPALDLDYPGKGPLSQSEYLPEIPDIFDICKSAKTLPAVILLDQPIENALQLVIGDDQEMQVKKLSSAPVPLALAHDSEVHVFRSPHIDEEHYAIIVRGKGKAEPLVRIHSACFTGDCLGSLKCDCGSQLNGALEQIGREGGVLLYMSQEGRGIGMANKMRAYKLQTQGFDTVEANQRLGFDDDERNFDLAAQMLKYFSINEIKLITNNPLKIEWMEKSGIKVAQRIALNIQSRPENADYLRTKATKSGHLL